MFKRGFLKQPDAFDASASTTSTASSAKKRATVEKENLTFKPGFLNRQYTRDGNAPVATTGLAAEVKPPVEKGSIGSTSATSHIQLSKKIEKENAESTRPDQLKSAPGGVSRKPPSKDIPFTRYLDFIDVPTGPKDMTAELRSNGYTGWPPMSVRICTTEASTLSYKDSSIFCVWLCYDQLFKTITANYNWGPIETPTPLPRPYRVAPSPGSGLGMFATRDIGVAETILVERPVLMIPQSCQKGAKSVNAKLDYAVSCLPKEALEGFNALTCCESMKKWGQKLGKIMTNGMKCNFPQADMFKTYSGVYLDAARSNHSCCPNAIWAFDSRTLYMEFRAARKIAAGEEITISYISTYRERADRQETLSSLYSFTCACRCCTLPPSQSKESDLQRRCLSLNPTVAPAKWKESMESSKIHWKGLIEALESGVLVAEQEGLDQEKAELHRYVAAAYAVIGDEVNFRKWAEKAKVTERLVERDGFGFVLNGEDWDSWLRDPTSIPCWNQMK